MNVDAWTARLRKLMGLAPDTPLDETERAENIEWMKRRGFRCCLDPLTGHYVAGFDRNQAYEFMRADWDEPAVLRLCDVHPAFNVWGLQYRPLDIPPQPR